MRRNIVVGIACVFAVLCLALTSLNAYILIVDNSGGVGEDWVNITLGKGVHMSVAKCYGKVEVLLFNQGLPYTGSIIGLSGDKSTAETGYEGWGIYFRSIKDVRRLDSWWTLMVSLWYPIIVLGIPPAVFLANKLRGRKSASPKKPAIEK